MSTRSRARLAARDPQVVAYWERRNRLAWQNTGTCSNGYDKPGQFVVPVKPVEDKK